MSDAQSLQVTGEHSTLGLSLFSTRFAISPSKARLNWRLELTNNGPAHIVALRVWSDLVSSKTAAIQTQTVGSPAPMDARLHQQRMIAPGETANFAGEWDLKREDFQPFESSLVHLLPVARFRFIGAGILPTLRTFVIGKQPPQDGGLPDALPCDGALQVFSNLVTHELELPEKERNKDSNEDSAIATDPVAT